MIKTVASNVTENQCSFHLHTMILFIFIFYKDPNVVERIVNVKLKKVKWWMRIQRLRLIRENNNKRYILFVNVYNELK